tara:strand:- start:9031 stop:9417 length:387 start_codon:yes stop_codon:yes gene_type:complete
MSLRSAAEADLAFILEDGVMGFGWPIKVINPDGVAASFTGYSNDISAIIDPDTGQAVSGRLASVAIRISTLRASVLGDIPRGISDNLMKPWIVDFDDINGLPYKFKVQQSNPDRALGIVTCLLEVYNP